MGAYDWLRLDATVEGSASGGRTAVGPSFLCRPNGGLKKRMVVCRCECGQLAVVESGTFHRQSRCPSCARNGDRNPNYRGGGCPQKRATPEYETWQRMKARCHNPNNPKFHQWGGRGIVVCDEWRGRGGFARFLESVGPRPAGDYSIDRIDNDRNYEPGNVRWATRKEQARNTRRNCPITINGRTLLLVEWAEQTGISLQTIADRKQRGLKGEALIA